MRIVFSGAGPVTVITAKTFTKQGHEVIIIEVNKELIDKLSEELDCSFIHGDAAKPAILRQVNPKDCDFLFCLTNSDEANIITGLLGRSMGFKRVIPSIEEAELQQLCSELNLEDTIIPVKTMSRHLDNMVQGLDSIELSTILKNDARLFSFIQDNKSINTAEKLELPEETKVLFYYRDDRFHFFNDDTNFKEGDEIIILTHCKNLPELIKRWTPNQTEQEDK